MRFVGFAMDNGKFLPSTFRILEKTIYCRTLFFKYRIINNFQTNLQLRDTGKWFLSPSVSVAVNFCMRLAIHWKMYCIHVTYFPNCILKPPLNKPEGYCS